ncbi:membrane protein [Actinobacillus equuli]|nr:membrane protein [Actinobacillus equuli]
MGRIGFLIKLYSEYRFFLAGIPIVLQALLLNGFSVGLAVLAGIVGINMLFGNVLEPKMMGKRLGLSTLVVFFPCFLGMAIGNSWDVAFRSAHDGVKNRFRIESKFSPICDITWRRR